MQLRGAFLLACIPLIGCGTSPSQHPQDGSTPSVRDGGAAVVETYTWRADWGPCAPGTPPCYEQFVVTRDGAVTRVLGGVAASTKLAPDDVSRFTTFLDDSALGAAIAGPACCMARPDRTETVTLTMASGAVPVSKNVFCCMGPEYDVIGQWTSTLESYFAASDGGDAALH